MSAMMCECVCERRTRGGKCGEGFKLESYRKSKSVSAAVVAIASSFVCRRCGEKKERQSWQFSLSGRDKHTEDLEIRREEELGRFLLRRRRLRY